MSTGTMTRLPYINGTPEPIECAQCGTLLGNERCVSTTRSGPKFFCKADPEYPLDSCFLAWKRRHQ